MPSRPCCAREINRNKSARVSLDLKPDLSLDAVEKRLERPRGRDSLANHLRRTLNLSSAAVGLLMENPERQKLIDYAPGRLARLIKEQPLTLTAPFSVERAISTAGGVSFDSLDRNFMISNKPGVFAAGEMLDWEAPTGGYLLQASIATGVRAAHGMISWLSG
jgi:predicted flavoprotein YhiN